MTKLINIRDTPLACVSERVLPSDRHLSFEANTCDVLNISERQRRMPNKFLSQGIHGGAAK
jgi:hypothetical protein